MPSLTAREEKILARAFVHVERRVWLLIMVWCGIVGGMLYAAPAVRSLFAFEKPPEPALKEVAFGALQIAFFCVLYAYGRFAADAYSLLRKLGGVKAKERL